MEKEYAELKQALQAAIGKFEEATGFQVGKIEIVRGSKLSTQRKTDPIYGVYVAVSG